MLIQRPSLNASLTPELRRFITGRTASGRYQTASEAMRAGLHLLEQGGLRAPMRADTSTSLYSECA